MVLKWSNFQRIIDPRPFHATLLVFPGCAPFPVRAGGLKRMGAQDGGTSWMWHADEIQVNIGARMEIKPRREDDGGHVRLGRPVMRVGKWRTSAAGTGGPPGAPGATRRRDTEPGNVVDVTLGRNPCEYRREDRDLTSARG